VLKVGAGYEKFGLGGKWLWHGTSLAKFGRTGNLVVMQRSQVKVSAPPSPRLELVICVKKLPRDPQASFGHNHSSDSFEGDDICMIFVPSAKTLPLLTPH
jgi:hypothetical protein